MAVTVTEDLERELASGCEVVEDRRGADRDLRAQREGGEGKRRRRREEEEEKGRERDMRHSGIGYKERLNKNAVHTVFVMWTQLLHQPPPPLQHWYCLPSPPLLLG